MTSLDKCLIVTGSSVVALQKSGVKFGQLLKFLGFLRANRAKTSLAPTEDGWHLVGCILLAEGLGAVGTWAAGFDKELSA